MKKKRNDWIFWFRLAQLFFSVISEYVFRMTEYINIVPEGTLSVFVRVCLSVEALALKRLNGFQRHSGFGVGQWFASGFFPFF